MLTNGSKSPLILNPNYFLISTKSTSQPNPNINQIQISIKLDFNQTQPNLIVVLGNQTKLN